MAKSSLVRPKRMRSCVSAFMRPIFHSFGLYAPRGGTLIILLFSVSVRAAIAYDLAGEFSVNSNPNGVWSYGWKSSIGGTFTLMDTARTNEIPDFRIWSWSVGGLSSPDAHYNADSRVFSAAGDTFPPGTLWVCPGSEGTTRNFGVMRFTTPANSPGNYRVEVAVQPWSTVPRPVTPTFMLSKTE
jgi:hypothetical protein